jgi:hypothetical protein
MDSPAFKVWSTALILMLLMIWVVNHIFTIKGLVTGDLLGVRQGRDTNAQDDTYGGGRL